jgi:hypothetical protein
VPITKPLDLTKVIIKPFSEETAVNQFTCGEGCIDRFLKNKAKKSGKRGEYRTFCAHVGDTVQCIAYYSLQIGSDSVSDLPRKNRETTYVGNYTAFPAVNLSFLGVHHECKRQGLGSFLLMDVFLRVAELAKHVGFYALTLQSLDENSTAFYKSLKFTVYSENINPPKMLYPLEDILTIVNKSKLKVIVNKSKLKVEDYSEAEEKLSSVVVSE